MYEIDTSRVWVTEYLRREDLGGSFPISRWDYNTVGLGCDESKGYWDVMSKYNMLEDWRKTSRCMNSIYGSIIRICRTCNVTSHIYLIIHMSHIYLIMHITIIDGRGGVRNFVHCGQNLINVELFGYRFNNITTILKMI